MPTPTDHKAEFLAAVKPYPAVIVAYALNSLTPGVSWTGCRKAEMAKLYAHSRENKHSIGNYLGLASNSLAKIKAACEEQKKAYVERRNQALERQRQKLQTMSEIAAQRSQRQQDLATLRSVIERENDWHGQGGAIGYLGDGQWSFASISIHFTGDEMNALFRLAGVEPKRIIPIGSCKTCAHSEDGRERGYRSRECCSCNRPIMSNFKAKA